MVSLEEAQERRFRALATTVGISQFGSLWFVPEVYWKRYARRYDQSSTRAGHPGCVVRYAEQELSADTIYMLHGSSKKSFRKRNVCVKDVMGEAQKTYFGSMGPLPFTALCWQNEPRIKQAHKASVNRDEAKELVDLCVAKGWSKI